MIKRSVLVISFLLVGTALFFSGKLYLERNQQIKKRMIFLEQKLRAWISLKNTLKDKVAGFKGTVGLVIKDLDSGWEIAFNQDTLIPSASLVKVPIMLSCFYAAQEGKINLKDNVRLKYSDKVAGSKVLGKEPAGARFTVIELFDPMITQSDNSAANALIEFVGMDTLNGYFKKMGLTNTNLSRKMMDFEERREGAENYTTAREMSYLLEKLYREEFLNKDVSRQCLALLRQQKINDRIPRKLPKDGVFVAHKTGLERNVCHDAGIVFTPKGNFIICVLVKHDSRFAAQAKRFISEAALLTFNFYQNI